MRWWRCGCWALGCFMSFMGRARGDVCWSGTDGQGYLCWQDHEHNGIAQSKSAFLCRPTTLRASKLFMRPLIMDHCLPANTQWLRTYTCHGSLANSATTNHQTPCRTPKEQPPPTNIDHITKPSTHPMCSTRIRHSPSCGHTW